MGYSYEFEGRFRVQPALSPPHREYLRRFADIRRVKRNRTLLRNTPDPLREAVGLPIGPDGCYFVGEERTAYGEVHQPSILDVNRPRQTSLAYGVTGFLAKTVNTSNGMMARSSTTFRNGWNTSSNTS